jgi:ABC-type nitrate/sulfonate/bicarbonate transport system permease component
MVEVIQQRRSRGLALRWKVRPNIRDAALGIGTLIAFLVLWEIIYAVQVFPVWAFPGPVGVAEGFVSTLSDGSLVANTWDSVVRQITGVVLAAVVGVPAGLFLGASPTIRAMFLPLCRLLYPIPGLAWVPLAILWFGVGFNSTVFVIFFTGVWPILFNTMAGVTTLSGQYTDVARVYLAPQMLYIRKILIPGSLPFILTGCRLTYGVGWRVIIGAEMISSIHGLGFMIDDARWQLRPDIMVVGMITIALIGWFVENWAFDWLERVTIERWGMKSVSV